MAPLLLPVAYLIAGGDGSELVPERLEAPPGAGFLAALVAIARGDFDQALAGNDLVDGFFRSR